MPRRGYKVQQRRLSEFPWLRAYGEWETPTRLANNHHPAGARRIQPRAPMTLGKARRLAVWWAEGHDDPEICVRVLDPDGRVVLYLQYPRLLIPTETRPLGLAGYLRAERHIIDSMRQLSLFEMAPPVPEPLQLEWSPPGYKTPCP